MTQFSPTPWLRASALATVAVFAAACNKPTPTADAPPPAAADKPASPAIAMIDGQPVTRAEFDLYVKQLTQGRPIELSPEQKAQVQDQLIAMRVMAAQGAKDHVDTDPEVVSALAMTRMNLLADGEYKKFVKDHQPTDQELHAEYDSYIAGMDKTEYHARHILVKDEALAQQLTKKLKGGANFEALAKANSIDPSGKTNGGDLGWFALARMVKPFGDALKTLQKGEITSTPVQTQFGWHVIKLEDTRPLSPPSFEQSKDQIEKRLLQKKIDAFLEDLKKTAKVEKLPVDPQPAGQPLVPQSNLQPAASAAASAATPH